MRSLIQKKKFETNTYELHEHSLKIVLKNLSKTVEEEFPYEKFDSKVVKYSTRETFLLFFVGGALIFGVFGAFVFVPLLFAMLAFSIFLYCLFYFSKKNRINIYLNNHKYISIDSEKPGPETVKLFIAELQEKVKTYLLEKYGTYDKDLSAESQLQNLVWLKNQNYLTKEEFEEKKDILFGRISSKKVGFNSEKKELN